MVPAQPPEWICQVLSLPRFAPYLTKTHGDLDAAVRLYWWNVKVSAAFYTPLHCLELTLRNAMHEQLKIGFDRQDWWAVTPLHPNGQRMVVAAIGNVAARRGRDYKADDIVAELSFGFWVSLLSRGAGYDRTLWVPVLHRAFPYYRGNRAPLHENFVTMQRLRNRIMHHEPIHHRDLRADHAKVYRLLGYISPIAARQLQGFDRVGDVLRHKDDAA